MLQKIKTVLYQRKVIVMKILLKTITAVATTKAMITATTTEARTSAAEKIL